MTSGSMLGWRLIDLRPDIVEKVLKALSMKRLYFRRRKDLFLQVGNDWPLKVASISVLAEEKEKRAELPIIEQSVLSAFRLPIIGISITGRPESRILRMGNISNLITEYGTGPW